MLENIEIKYKGFTLIFNPDTEEWHIDGEGYGNASKSFKTIKQKVDAISRQDFQRFDAWDLGWHSSKAELVTVTSMTEDGEAWIIKTERGKSRRMKERSKDLYKATDANKVLIDSMALCDQETNKLNKKIGELRGQLETITGQRYGEFK